MATFFKITKNHLIPQRRDVLDKLMVSQAVQKFLAFSLVFVLRQINTVPSHPIP